MNRKILLLALLFAMLTLLPAAGLAQQTLGNETAGYMTTDFTFVDFQTVGISEESLAQMRETIGYCQYCCFDQSILSGTVITMQAFPSHTASGISREENLENCLNLAYVSLYEVFSQPDYQVAPVTFDEKTIGYLMTMVETDPASNISPVFIAVLSQEEGNCAVYFFESYPHTEEAYQGILDLLLTFQPGGIQP